MERVEVISNYLKLYSNKISEIYNWKVNLDRLKEFKIDISFLNQENDFQLQLDLKHILSEKLNENKNNFNEFLKISEWIIKDWGGISTGNSNEELIKKAINKVDNGEYQFDFDRIASISKVLSFYRPSSFAIYDSRVAYSLNWILLKNGYKDSFFPIPSGRNSKMKAFDVNVLIRIVQKEKYSVVTDIKELKNKKHIHNADSEIYIEESKAYENYINLIKPINSILFPDNKDDLFYTEMLLFSISDNYIFNDIINSINLTIQK